jgi:hypothetical protein
MTPAGRRKELSIATGLNSAFCGRTRGTIFKSKCHWATLALVLPNSFLNFLAITDPSPKNTSQSVYVPNKRWKWVTVIKSSEVGGSMKETDVAVICMTIVSSHAAKKDSTTISQVRIMGNSKAGYPAMLVPATPKPVVASRKKGMPKSIMKTDNDNASGSIATDRVCL